MPCAHSCPGPGGEALCVPPYCMRMLRVARGWSHWGVSGAGTAGGQAAVFVSGKSGVLGVAWWGVL